MLDQCQGTITKQIHLPGAVLDSGHRGGALYLVDLEVDPREC